MNAIKGVLVGLAATAVLFGGAAQAIAAPATSQSAEASSNVTGEVVAVVKGKSIKVRVDASTTVDVDYDLKKTVISGELKVGGSVDVNGKKVGGRIVASGIIVIK
ncbi:hypothetical protein UK23_20540 [Lentzea aerocolonigenes]|uniref:DUF5666 domain-containing protein n=1 Tax=Lentzea aerocolonigenes TaxID=68170 RepID=A0A0F0GXM7_LENAE|nr:hypothetical protein [Lentzea aerocolonigenes]KJK47336.1 hypothetical protein UK23_20540 [Lentzea aerocolonigenes]